MSDQLSILDYDTAKDRRDDGMARAATHSSEEWRKVAIEMIRDILPGTVFLAEEIRVRLDAMGITTHDRRALGPVVMAARKQGLIEECGAARAKTSNLSLKPLWRRVA